MARIQATTLHDLPGLARELNLSSLHDKDESTRFTLKSFKALGGAYAVVSEGRTKAIAAFGAEVIRLPGNYDDAVRHAASQAQQHGWTVVSDTCDEDYRDIPIDVTHDYGVMSREVVRQLKNEPSTHVIVQAGVGAFAASVCAVFGFTGV